MRVYYVYYNAMTANIKSNVLNLFAIAIVIYTLYIYV